MKEFGTFHRSEGHWRVMGGGIPEIGEYYVVGGDVREMREGYRFGGPLPVVIVERVEEEKPPPPCEHRGASPPNAMNSRWHCRDCGVKFHATVFTADDGYKIRRRWRVIAVREPRIDEFYTRNRICVGQQRMNDHRFTDTDIVVPADEAT